MYFLKPVLVSDLMPALESVLASDLVVSDYRYFTDSLVEICLGVRLKEYS